MLIPHWHVKDTDGEDDIFYDESEARESLAGALTEERKMNHAIRNLGHDQYQVEYKTGELYRIWLFICTLRSCSPS